MAGQPIFTSECADAFNMMNTQESPNDFFVCGFEGNTHEMKLVEMGKGGMARVKEILRDQFADQTAVAMFRVTAVDDRENTVSYRTKLIHVIYTGPNTPVMKRAKIAPFNSAFKQPFTFNMSIQTSDEAGDLNQASIEKALRASGGAHQPTRFDFDNASAPGEGETKAARRAESSRSPTQASPSPTPSSPKPPSSPSSPARKAEPEPIASAGDIMRRHEEAYDAKNLDGIAADYAEDAKLFHTDATEKRTSLYSGPAEIAQFYQYFLDQHGDAEMKMLKADVTGNVATLEYECPATGIHYGLDVFYITKGKIVLQTVTTVSGTAAAPVEDTPEGMHEILEGGAQQEESVEDAVGEAVPESAKGMDEEAIEDAAQETAAGEGEWEAVEGEAPEEEQEGDAAPPIEEQEGEANDGAEHEQDEDAEHEQDEEQQAGDIATEDFEHDPKASE